MLEALQWFVDLGATVVLPILIFIFGMLLGGKPGKSFVSGLKVGIGFIGLNLVIGLLSSSLGPAAQEMVANMGLSLTTIDVGWPAAAAISYGTILGSLAIPIGVAMNAILLLLGLTKTLNVDIWNYWHAAFVASMVYAISGNFTLGLYSTVVYMLMLYLLSDLIGPIIKKFYGFPNITFAHGTAAPGFLFALPLNWVFDRIPGFNKLEADAESIQKRFGVFGDTTVMGLVIGVAIGFLAGYDFPAIAKLGVETSAIMILMPRMVSVLMEGLTPISETANALVKKRFPGRDLYIGMDAAISVGHPAVLSSSLLLVPITIALAVILPGNSTLPFGDLAAIPFIVCLMAAVFKGNIIRTVLGGTIYMGLILYIASWTAPLMSSAAVAASFDLAGNTSITALSEGGLYSTYMFVLSAQNLPWIGITLIGVICLAGLIYVNKPFSRKNKGE